MRVLCYVQHVLGVGHVQRTAALVAALLRRGVAVKVVHGGRPVPGLVFPGAELVQLPPLHAGDGLGESLVGADGRPVDGALWRRRRELLMAAFERDPPGLLLCEMFPFGRLHFVRELLPLVEAAAQRGIPCWSSVRDIVVERSPGMSHLMTNLARKHFERVLVHGDPRLGRLEEIFSPAAAIAERLDHTGFVVAPIAQAAPSPAPRRGVVISAGGGAVGETLLRTSLAARPATRYADRPWHLLCGQHLPASVVAELRTAAPDGVHIENFRSDLPQLLAGAEVSVSQAGYNTSIELAALGTPMVLVPFASDAHSDQVERARRWQRAGLATVVDEAELDAERLAAAIDHAAPPRYATPLDLGGAGRSAELIRQRLETA